MIRLSSDADKTELGKVTLSEEIKRKYRQRASLSLPDRLRMTWRGQTDVGKVLGIGLDIAEIFLPKWVAKTRTLIQYNRKPMLQKILSIKNLINVRDEDGNFDWSELAASLLQIVLAGAIVWGAQALGIWDGLMKVLSQ